MVNRVILMVLDSVGIGELPDAKEYGDAGVNTLGHIAESIKGFSLPNLQKMGLGNIEGLDSIESTEAPTGAFGKCFELSKGKDTTTGHWEIAGIVLKQPFPQYLNGFPKEVMDKFEEAIGKKTIGNKPSSGTVILDELGEEHMKTGMPIVYTSADSVFQIAAHEDIISVDELYKMCEIARAQLQGEHGVGRVIARPFVGEPGNFTRTSNRHDYSLEPIHEMMLDNIKEAGQEVNAVGKIKDIYCGRGVSNYVYTTSNMDGVDKTIDYIKQDSKGLIFSNLVDFDMVFGHRRNVEGYGDALKEFDARLPEIIENMKDDDVLMITADHGCDPTHEGSDHTREYIPLIVYGKNIKNGVDLGIRKSFADIGATVVDMLNVKQIKNGESFKSDILK